MTAAQRNANNRRKGKTFERDTMKGFRSAGMDYERTRDTGEKDEGDGVLRLASGHRVVVEAKSGALHLGPFLKEAEVEAGHYAHHRELDPELVFGAVLSKRRGLGWGKSAVIMEVDEFIRLLKLIK